MSGDDSYRAVLADCERALGRPDVALRLVAEALAAGPDAEETVELRLVEAGARRDLGEDAAARLVLEAALGGRPDPAGLDAADEGLLRMAAAYADLLRAQGEDERADQFRAAVAAIDPELVGEGVGVEFTEVEEDGLDQDDANETDDAHETDGVDETDNVDETHGAVDTDDDDDEAEDEPGPSGMSFEDEVEAEVAELLGETGPEGDDAGH